MFGIRIYAAEADPILIDQYRRHFRLAFSGARIRSLCLKPIREAVLRVFVDAFTLPKLDLRAIAEVMLPGSMM